MMQTLLSCSHWQRLLHTGFLTTCRATSAPVTGQPACICLCRTAGTESNGTPCLRLVSPVHVRACIGRVLKPFPY